MPAYIVTLYETRIQRVITVALDSKAAKEYAMTGANIRRRGPLYFDAEAKVEEVVSESRVESAVLEIVNPLDLLKLL